MLVLNNSNFYSCEILLHFVTRNALNALTLLVWHQEEHLACKN